ncbi:PQQ-binding-like beta-propeller repeat protein [Sphingomonas quercus]|uniref:PQQ-binding-like beta-propeller repeat protein n=1 Tax=Sphingomonas quercus TaxID=2842451 RepID=A0ABS6BJX5_9SPHN|nr:PQQ-binding-like beta-propeller repeat protein [Sphingomonas quercus]MBU3078601.1 PQQ-binding-like beta-propeller repeat protein [Sphingomonas quercus]
MPHAFRLGVAAIALLAPAMLAAQAPANDWPTWGYDQERTGWNRGETALGTGNVGKLKLQWTAKLPAEVTDVALSTLTAPVIAAGVQTAQGVKNILVVLSADDKLFAVDADTGAMLWQKSFPNAVKPTKQATWLCPNTANATPTIDKARGVVFFLASDGKLRGVNLADGAERLAATEMVAPFARAWSLNLISDVVYATSGRACGEITDPKSAMYAARDLKTPFDPANRPTDPSSVTAVDVTDLARPELTRFYLSSGRPAAPWGRGGLARGPNDSVIFETSDGPYDPAAGNWSDTIVRLSHKAARVLDSFTPENHRYLSGHDLGGSASPVVFPFGGKTLVAVAQKESVLRLLNADDMGGGALASHQKPLFQSPVLGNEGAVGTDPSSGVWGAITTYANAAGRRFLYLPMWGPLARTAPEFKISAGDTPNGSVLAFEVVEANGTVSAVPLWKSGDMIMPDPPVVANGVVYALSTGGQALQNYRVQGGPRLVNTTPEAANFRATPIGNLTLYAYDAETGKQLYSSGKTLSGWVHFSEPVVALGKVFVVTHDAQIHALGVDDGKPTARSRR